MKYMTGYVTGNVRMMVISTMLACWFTACSGDDDKYVPCNTKNINKAFYSGIMTETYYWYDKVPEVNPEDFSSPAEILEAVKYKELDRWSYITTKASHTNLFKEGKYLGLGFVRAYDDNGGCFISAVYKGSPIDQQGIVRGDKILEINGKTIEQIESENLWPTISGPDEEGIQVAMKIEHADHSVDDYTLEKSWIIINTVLHTQVIEQNQKKIGYLVFMSFLETSFAELEAAFADLKTQGVDELILDLRYNGGGLLSVATRLASLISGDITQTKTFIEFIHNDKYSHNNQSVLFENPASALDLDHLVVITAPGTCSASESVINSLRPFIDVITIGDTTCGKPVGMYAYELCDLSVSVINFEIVNSQNIGGYFNGIAADCAAGDGLHLAFGDTQEDSLQEALYVLENQQCSPQSFWSQNNPRRFTPRPLEGFRREVGAF